MTIHIALLRVVNLWHRTELEHGPEAGRACRGFMSHARKKMFILSLVVLLCGMVASCDVASDPRPEPQQVLKITVFPRQGWILDFYPDGRVHAQWGSLPGDGASLPEGTIKFEALLAAIRRLRIETKIDNGTQVAVLEGREPSATAFYVSDDTLFRYLMVSLHDKWAQDAGGTRFRELLEANPIYPDDGSP